MWFSFRRNTLHVLRRPLFRRTALVLAGLGAYYAFEASKNYPTWYPGNWWRQVAYGQYYCPGTSSVPTVNSGVLSGSMSGLMMRVLRDPRISEITLSSPGGNVTAIDELPRLVERVRVTAPICNSACAWMVALHDNVCVDESLPSLGFHTAIQGNWCNADGSKVVVEKTTRALLARVPDSLRARLKDLLPAGEIPRDTIVYVPTDEFLSMFPDKACDRVLP